MPDNYFIPMQAKQAEAVSPRLRATLVRIVAGPLARFRAPLTARQNKWLQQLAKEMGIRLSLFLLSIIQCTTKNMSLQVERSLGNESIPRVLMSLISVLNT